MHIHTQIREALNTFNIDEARRLVREAIHTQPDAETYYLASLVALTPQQKQEFLQKAYAIDPFHLHVLEALNQTSNATITEPVTTPEPIQPVVYRTTPENHQTAPTQPIAYTPPVLDEQQSASNKRKAVGAIICILLMIAPLMLFFITPNADTIEVSATIGSIPIPDYYLSLPTYMATSSTESVANSDLIANYPALSTKLNDWGRTSGTHTTYSNSNLACDNTSQVTFATVSMAHYATIEGAKDAFANKHMFIGQNIISQNLFTHYGNEAGLETLTYTEPNCNTEVYYVSVVTRRNNALFVTSFQGFSSQYSINDLTQLSLGLSQDVDEYVNQAIISGQKEIKDTRMATMIPFTILSGFFGFIGLIIISASGKKRRPLTAEEKKALVVGGTVAVGVLALLFKNRPKPKPRPTVTPVRHNPVPQMAAPQPKPQVQATPVQPKPTPPPAQPTPPPPVVVHNPYENPPRELDHRKIDPYQYPNPSRDPVIRRRQLDEAQFWHDRENGK